MTCIMALRRIIPLIMFALHCCFRLAAGGSLFWVCTWSALLCLKKVSASCYRCHVVIMHHMLPPHEPNHDM